MPKVHWLDVPQASSYRLLVGTIPLGEDDTGAIYSPLLKTTLALAARACAKLRLVGRYALQGARTPQLEVHIAFENSDDAHTFGRLVGLQTLLPTTPSTFTFDEQTTATLEKLAGPPDNRSTFRRAKERAEQRKALLDSSSQPVFSTSYTRRQRAEDR